MPDQPAQIVQHEPDLVVEQERAEGAVVVEEVERGGEGGFVHGSSHFLLASEPPVDGIGSAAYSPIRRVLVEAPMIEPPIQIGDVSLSVSGC